MAALRVPATPTGRLWGVRLAPRSADEVALVSLHRCAQKANFLFALEPFSTLR